MGASGSGKDTLLDAIEARGAAAAIARRYITRDRREGCELHTPLSASDFERLEREGHFLFNWHAHGFQYGIGREVLDELAGGRSVVMNGSRRYLATAREIYPQLLPVCLEVSPGILEARLCSRGRETPRQIALRLQRAVAYARVIPRGVIRVSNNGSIEEAAEQVLGLLEARA